MEKTAKGLVEYAIAQLGRPYWYGTYGQLGTQALYIRKSGQYPAYYKWSYTPEAANQKVHDCAGLIKGYLWCDSPDAAPAYNKLQDKSAKGLYSACKEKGKIKTLPETPGTLVFMSGHVGVYIGGGEVVEARGHDYGVVKTRLSERPWKNWGICPYITYEQEKGEVCNVEVPVLKKGAKGACVKAMQQLLIANKCSCGWKGADSSFGPATDKALRQYQKQQGLSVDGSCGPKTWASLLGV